MKHTPISKLPWSNIDNEIKNSEGHIVAECSSEERASQIVLAVNSFEENEKKLELAYGFSDMFKKQRDELLQAAKTTLSDLNKQGAIGPISKETLLKLLNAIKKAEGK